MQDTAPGPTLPAVTARPLQRRLLTQCVVLAGLLHIAVVVVFGNSPGGSAEPGEGLWGAIQVRLAGPPAPDSREAAGLGQAATGPAGAAVRQRLGGSVRPDAAPQATDSPGAAQAGRWLPQPADGDPEAPPFAATELPARQAPDAPPALASPERPPALVAPAMPAPPSPPATPVSRIPPALPAAPVAEPPSALPPTVAPPVLPIVSTPGAGVDAPRRAPLRQPASPPVLAPPALPEPAMPAMPEAPAFTTQAPLPPRALTPRNPTASVAPLQAQALTPTPPLAPPLPVVPVQAAPPPRQVAPRDPAAALPALAPADLGATAPPPTPALPGFAVAAPANAAAPAAQPPTGAGLSENPATPTAPAMSATSAAPAGGVAATPDGARRVAGTPEAGPQVGRDVATPPSQAASAARLNLDLVRPPRGGPLTAGSSSGLLSVVPHPPEQKSKLAQDIETAAKADCRKAYSGMGLAAVLPLAVDALRDKGCRW